jgi:hypothetical protein
MMEVGVGQGAGFCGMRTLSPQRNLLADSRTSATAL